jgi:RNA polymerase sigma-70 factor, ECF subfamily
MTQTPIPPDDATTAVAETTGLAETVGVDADLLRAIRTAQRAFARRLDPVRPDLHRYCRRLTGNLWDAEDLVQETLTRAFARAADSHRPVQRLLPWLLRIATNAYIDSWRWPRPSPRTTLID